MGYRSAVNKPGNLFKLRGGFELKTKYFMRVGYARIASQVKTRRG
jgi:hypothetical protein